MHWLLLLVLVVLVLVVLIDPRHCCIACTEWTHHIVVGLYGLYWGKQGCRVGELWWIDGFIAWIWSWVVGLSVEVKWHRWKESGR